MLTDRLDFQAWLAKHDADGFALRYRVGKELRPDPETRGECDGCGGPLGDTPSRLREHCIVCLAERFGGDQVEEELTKTLLGGMVKMAMKSEGIADELVVTAVQDAIREYECDQGAVWGARATEREGVA